MAGAHSSRPKRRNTRLGGNRPRTHPTPNARRKPAPPKPSKLHKAADARPNAERIGGSRDAETQVVREMRDGVSITLLKEIHRKLEIAGAVTYICAATLRAQAADYDNDVALCLRRLVGDEIDRQMEQIDGLLGRERTFHDGEDEGGAV